MPSLTGEGAPVEPNVNKYYLKGRPRQAMAGLMCPLKVYVHMWTLM